MKPETSWLGRTFVVLSVMALLAPTVAAQEGGGNWTAGEDNEFGTIRGPYSVNATAGSPATVEYHVTLNTLYRDQDARYFMFMLSGKGTALDVRLTSLKTAAGDEIEIYQKDSSNGVPKWTVDIADMPSPGTKMVLKGTATGTESGFWQAHTMVIPFTYRWEKVRMENGLEAKLQALTQVEVTGSAGFCGDGGCGTDAIKDVPAPAALVPATLAVGALAWRRRET